MTRLLVHIGHHKTGTSWLQQVLFPQHPLFVPLVDSAAPWNDALMRALVAVRSGDFDAASASRLLQERISRAQIRHGQIGVVSAERLSGHPLSGGYDSHAIAGRIHQIAPDALVFGVVRGQRSMIRSSYQQLVMEGFPGTIEQWLFAETWKGTGFRWEYYEFDRLLRRYQALFGPEQVLFMRYEGLIAEPGLFIRQLTEFCGLPEPAGLQDGRVNQSLGCLGTRVFRHLNHLRRTELNRFPMVALPHAVFPATKRALRLIERLTGSKDLLLPQGLEQEIEHRYAESNARLAALIDRVESK